MLLAGRLPYTINPPTSFGLGFTGTTFGTALCPLATCAVVCGGALCCSDDGCALDASGAVVGKTLGICPLGAGRRELAGNFGSAPGFGIAGNFGPMSASISFSASTCGVTTMISSLRVELI